MTHSLSFNEREEKRIYPLEFWTDEVIRSIAEGFHDSRVGPITQRYYRSINRDSLNNDIAATGFTMRWRASITDHEDPNDRVLNMDDADLGLKSTKNLMNRQEYETPAKGKGSKVRRTLDRKSGGVLTSIFNQRNIHARDLCDKETFDTSRVYFETVHYMRENGTVGHHDDKDVKRVVIAVCLDTVQFLHKDADGRFTIIGRRAESELEIKRKACHAEGTNLITDSTATPIQTEGAMLHALQILEESTPKHIWPLVQVATESKARQAARVCQEYMASLGRSAMRLVA